MAVAQIPGPDGDNADGSIVEVGRQAGRQQPDRPGVHRRRRQRRCRSTSRAGRRRPATATTRLPPARATSGPRASSTHCRDPSLPEDDNGKPSLLTQVCARSAAVGELEGVDGARPFCTGDGVGAVLAVIGTATAAPATRHPRWSASTSRAPPAPFLTTYEGVRVECAKFGEDYSIGRDRADPRRRAGRPRPCPPTPSPPAAAAWTRTSARPTPTCRWPGSPRPAASPLDQVDDAGRRPHRRPGARASSGEPAVNVLELNLDLDQKYPVPRS